jgi:mono/diheme cytochrome c family protein
MFHRYKIGILLGCLLTGIIIASFTLRPSDQPRYYLSDDDSLWSVYDKLGKIRFNAVNTSIKGVSVERGRDLILNGSCEKADGKGRTKEVSPYFKCTACHNIEKEFSDLSNVSSEKRLEYAIANDLPFLQGSSFYGLINRKTFYNDDYQKKYGHVPIIKASNTDIRKAIQLCATQCAQGRWLEDFEVESILAYYTTLGLKVKDLNLTKEEQATVETAMNNKENQQEAIHLLEGKYLEKSPAHFVHQAKHYEALDANALKDVARYKNGQAIYERSCLHCHQAERYSFFSMNDGKMTFANLLSRTKSNGKTSLYEITRHGTWPLAGSRAYMPLYPIEKLSETQLEDLRIYIENRAMGQVLAAK